MPYDLTFKGGFFQIADFFGQLDSMVHVRGGGALVDGRLLTIDGFNLKGDSGAGFPRLDATVNVTSYVTPADQGLVAGATPTGPAPATSAPTDDSSSSSDVTPAPIAAVK
jgi:hypothetical protein